MAEELFHLPVHLFPRMQLLVARLILREAERFLGAECEHTEHRQTLVEQRMHPILQLTIEINQNVAAEDDIEFRKRPVCHQIVLREHDVSRERWTKERTVVFRG